MSTEGGGAAGAIDVVDNPSQSRFEAVVKGHLAQAEYVRHGDTIIFTHTEVPQELAGRGVGGALAHAALEQARAQGLTVVARCPFMAKYIERHQEYQPLLRRESRA
jgi:predicted GNAT family acetyltransferase